MNARVELDDRGLVVHSRSGTDRNRDYRKAVEAIFSRLDAAGIRYEIFLDSRPVQHEPLSARRLPVPVDAPIAERFDALVRAMNEGGSSNGAWRRILVAGQHHAPAILADAVAHLANTTTDFPSRLAAAYLHRVSYAHVDRAVSRLIAGEDAPNFSPSRDFDLLTPSGERLAPKKVFGLALEEALGIDAQPKHFSAGLGTPCFQILEAAGYPIVRKEAGDGAEGVDLDMAAGEGSAQLVAHLRRERKPALAAAKRRAMIAQLGYLQCERCGIVPGQTLGPYGDAVIEVHHARTLVSDMAEGHITRLADLKCLCANCHRIVHREFGWAG